MTSQWRYYQNNGKIRTSAKPDKLYIIRKVTTRASRKYNAGINLTGYHPPGHSGAFAPKFVPSPRDFAQKKIPGDRANK